MRIIRDYEVSIWTLQDSFITVLKPFGIELKGQIQDPDFKLADDGTQEFTFKLPMYYSLNGERIENPLWCNTINGIIVAGMRKVKLIFKKHTPQQKVYELSITKVIESHEKDQLMCEITCEGLAFHELGKIGYRISLETEDITYEQDSWFEGTEMEDENGEKYILGSDQRRYGLEMPQPTLQYWNDKIFKRKDGQWKWNWQYEIRMDYSNNPGLGRVNNKVYEDEYISSWAYNPEHDQVEAQAYESDREKYRTVDLTESNVYNLTQDLAKEFGVFCRYEYEHDDNFHIIGRKVTDIITKMYVNVESDDGSEQVTIMNSSANKTREDYILNFDYLNTVGAITPQQYEEVKKFEKDIYNINMQLIPLYAQQIALQDQLPTLKAEATTYNNSITGDQEAQNQANDLLNALTNNTGIIEVTADNPKMGIIMGENPNYIKISELGVDYSTLHIYKTYNTSTHVLTDEYQGSPVYDEFNNLVQVQNLQHYQSYNYMPSTGLLSLNGEYGHLRSFENDIENKIATYGFIFNSSKYKDLFKKLNDYLLTSFQLSFNIDFETPPSNEFSAYVYFLHANETLLDQQPVFSKSYTTNNNTVRYYPTMEVLPTAVIEDFRFNSQDYSHGLQIIIKIEYNDGQFPEQGPMVDNGVNSTNGIKASLKLGGKKEATEGNTSRVQSRVYLTYSYSPKLYYERVIQIWKNRETVDVRKLVDVNHKIETINTKLDECLQKLNKLEDERDLLYSRFERLMGPALREGYWQPEDYKDYGESHLEIFHTAGSDIAYIQFSEEDSDTKYKYGYLDDESDDTKVETKFIFDSEPLSDEQVNYIHSFSQDNGEEYLYYPCIKLTNNSIINFVKEHYNNLSISFCDVTQLDTKYITNPVYRKIYHINSRCEYAYMNIDGVPTPVIMVTGARDDNLTDRQFAALTGQNYIADNITYDEFDNIDVRLTVIDPLDSKIQASYKLKKSDWFIPTDIKQLLYPRLQISSLNLRTDSDEIGIKYNNNLLSNYEEYSLLPYGNSYYATIKPIVFAHYGYGLDGEIRFIVSNANTSVYLDALQVAKENSRPKVEYEITTNSVNKNFIDEAYNYLGYIANINDFDLKFENVRGYISELDLKLDKPQEDTATIKNYKTKFEDLFSTIVAQTEQMQKNAATLAVASSIFTTNGKLVPDVVEESIRHVNLDEAFSKGTLTWDEAEGMWAESDSGVVAIRGGGIFTATQQDASGNWKWNTGITPEGINADLITAGQLDTNRIKVYAGDQLRFQLNSEGLFAYKTMFDNPKPEYVLAQNYATISKEIQDNHGIDYRQYVVHNGEGLFLIAEKGAPLILEDRGQDGYYIRRLEQQVERVSVTWDGLTLRNYNNEKVFYADADTGDLTLAGTIYAKAGVFEGEVRAKSLFIGEDTTQNYIDEDGHLLPSVFSEEVASGLTKAASLTVDNDSGKILLSSLQFDTLGAESSGILIKPDSLQFYTQRQIQDSIESEDSSVINETVNSMTINTTGIELFADGLIKINSSNNDSILSFGQVRKYYVDANGNTVDTGTEEDEVFEFEPALTIGGVSGNINCQSLMTNELIVNDSLIVGTNAGNLVQGITLLENGDLAKHIYVSDYDPPLGDVDSTADNAILIHGNSLWLKKVSGSQSDTSTSNLITANATYKAHKMASATWGYNQYFAIAFYCPTTLDNINEISATIRFNTFPSRGTVYGWKAKYDISPSADVSSPTAIDESGDGYSIDKPDSETIYSSYPLIRTFTFTLGDAGGQITAGQFLIIRGEFKVNGWDKSNPVYNYNLTSSGCTCTITGNKNNSGGTSVSSAITSLCNVYYISNDVYFQIPTA